MDKTKKPITEEILLTWLIHWRDVIEKEVPGGFESNVWLQDLYKLYPVVLLLMAKQLDEFVNTENFKTQACADLPQLSGHVLTVAESLGAYFARVNNLMWMSVCVIERPESADYKQMYQTFYMLTGCDDGAKYFTDLLWNMDRLLVFGYHSSTHVDLSFSFGFRNP